MPMSHQEVRALILSFPETEEGTAYGHPAYKAFGKFFTRIRGEDDSLVLLEVDFDERVLLIEADPATFHVTAHYRNYPAVLARIPQLDPDTLLGLLERRWRKLAPRKRLEELEAQRLR